MKTYGLVCVLLLVGLMGCSRKETAAEAPSSDPASSPGSPPAAAKSEDFVVMDESPGPHDKRYLETARPFAVALAAGDYAAAYNMLSSHAKASMRESQFQEGKDDAESETLDKTVHAHVTAEQFAALMNKVEALHGRPSKPLNLHIQSTDPAVLSGKVGGEVTGIDVMLAIGMISDSIPVEIRKASLRGRTGTSLSDETMAEMAKQQGTTVEDLKKDADFQPYYNYKIVLVEENGELKVGHFEFMRPSMMD